MRNIVDNIALSLGDMIPAIFQENMSDDTVGKAVVNAVLGWISLAGAPPRPGQLDKAVKTQTSICDLKLERQLIGRFVLLFQLTNTSGGTVTDLEPMEPDPGNHSCNSDGNENDDSASGLGNGDGGEADESACCLESSSDSSANGISSSG